MRPLRLGVARDGRTVKVIVLEQDEQTRGQGLLIGLEKRNDVVRDLRSVKKPELVSYGYLFVRGKAKEQDMEVASHSFKDEKTAVRAVGDIKRLVRAYNEKIEQRSREEGFTFEVVE